MPKPTYDTSVTRMAENIAAGIVRGYTHPLTIPIETTAKVSVALARAIVEEVRLTEPKADSV